VKQFVLMNANNGMLGLGVRVQLFDSVVAEEPLAKLGNFSVTVRSDQYDGWLIFSGIDDAEGPWLWVQRDYIDSKMEILGEL